MIELTVPMPPSDNRYYGKPKGNRHKFLTRAAREFRDEVTVIVLQKRLRGAVGKDRVTMQVTLNLKYGGDILNRAKGLCDALQYSGLLDDDGQIDDVRFIRGDKQDTCDITIWHYPE